MVEGNGLENRHTGNRIVSSNLTPTAMDNSKLKNEEYWKSKLTPEQYEILRKGATEAPFTGALLHNKENGIYSCAACGQELFSSQTKFESGSGWPSFFDAVDPQILN